VNTLECLLEAIEGWVPQTAPAPIYQSGHERAQIRAQVRDHLLAIACRDWVVQVLDSAARCEIINNEGAGDDRYQNWWPGADEREREADRVWPLLPESERKRIGERPRTETVDNAPEQGHG
jgi:hypothetical protein